MSFQNLRAGSTLYILHKEQKPFVEIAQVLSVTNPAPKYQIGNIPYPANQEMVVDVQAKVGDASYNYQKLPAALDIVDFGNNTVGACTKEAIMSELVALKQLSQDALSRHDYHVSVIAGCDEAIKVLNPEIAERQRQEEENKALRAEVAELKGMVADMASLKDTMAELLKSLK